MSAEQWDTLITATSGLIGALLGAVTGGWMSRKASLEAAERSFRLQAAAARHDRLAVRVERLSDLASEMHVQVMRREMDVDTIRRLTGAWALVAALARSESPHLAAELERYAAVMRGQVKAAQTGDWHGLRVVLENAGVLFTHWLRDPHGFEGSRPTFESMASFRPESLE